jgi:3-oxoacyl-[acyl-carrier protein] reductase
MAGEALAPEEAEFFKQQTPLEKRLGTPEEIASAVAFLASPQASWVTGGNLDLTGGL